MPVTPLIRADRLIIILTARLWDRAGGAGDVKLALDTALPWQAGPSDAERFAVVT